MKLGEQSRAHHRRRVWAGSPECADFQREGAKVAIVDIDGDRAEQSLKLVEGGGRRRDRNYR